MGKYDDIIDLPHHVSTKHKPMSRESRAAQFAPFAALTGYGEAVLEVTRQTSEKIELSEDEIGDLNERIAYLKEILAEKPLVSITYFVPDSKKDGGAYVTVEGVIYTIDEIEGIITMVDKKKIPMVDIRSIESDVFSWDIFDD